LAAVEEAQKESGKKINTGAELVQRPVQYAQSAGADSDILDATSSISFAEKKLNHKMEAEKSDAPNVSYNQKW